MEITMKIVSVKCILELPRILYFGIDLGDKGEISLKKVEICRFEDGSLHLELPGDEIIDSHSDESTTYFHYHIRHQIKELIEDWLNSNPYFDYILSKGIENARKLSFDRA